MMQPGGWDTMKAVQKLGCQTSDERWQKGCLINVTTIDGFLAAIESPACVGETINLGNNYEVSIERLVKLIAPIMGVEVEIQVDDMRLRPAC
jgi:nucleoside-diphosphate-sugar epimerase